MKVECTLTNYRQEKPAWENTPVIIQNANDRRDVVIIIEGQYAVVDSRELKKAIDSCTDCPV